MAWKRPMLPVLMAWLMTKKGPRMLWAAVSRKRIAIGRRPRHSEAAIRWIRISSRCLVDPGDLGD